MEEGLHVAGVKELTESLKAVFVTVQSLFSLSVFAVVVRGAGMLLISVTTYVVGTNLSSDKETSKLVDEDGFD